MVSDGGRPGQDLGYRLVVGLLLALYVVASWAPFRLDPPFRADDVPVGDAGAWQFSGRSLAASDTPPGWLADAIDVGYLEVTLEVVSASPRQHGPARILTISRDTRHQNLMVGQEAGDLVVRVHRPDADLLGAPAYVVPEVFAAPVWRTIRLRIDHEVRLWIDGEEAGRLATPSPRAFDAWDREHLLALGNEQTWDRGWEGAIRHAMVQTAQEQTDLLSSELTTTWDRKWILPSRLLEAPERSPWQRVPIGVLHLLVGVLVVVAGARGWPGRAARNVLLVWMALAMVVNLGKVVIDTRHPSLVTTTLQMLGGGLGAGLASGGVPGWRHRSSGSDPVDHTSSGQATDRRR